MSSPADSPEGRLARWAERDAVVGLDAELTQARLALAERDATLVDLRARVDQLGNRVAQLEIERNALQHRVTALARPPLGRRAFLRARGLVGRGLRAVGLR